MSRAQDQGRPSGGGLRRMIILAVMVAGVAALVVILTVVRNRPPQIPEAEPTPGKPEISRIDIERITAVSLDGPGREQPFNMQKTGAGWQIEGADSAIPIKESRIKDLLYSFSSLYAERVIEEDAADLGQYGLDPPAVVAVATLDDGTTIEVHLGDRTPAGNTWYLGLPDKRIVYAVWTNHGNHYYYTVADMRGDELPAVNGEALNYLLRRGGGMPTIEVVETNPLDTRFRHLLTRLAMIQPYAFPRAIDGDEFAKVQAAVAAPRIDRIVSDDPEAAASYGLAPPRYEVVARDTAGAEVALLFGDERDDEIFFQVRGRATTWSPGFAYLLRRVTEPVYAMKRSRAGVLWTAGRQVRADPQHRVGGRHRDRPPGRQQPAHHRAHRNRRRPGGELRHRRRRDGGQAVPRTVPACHRAARRCGVANGSAGGGAAGAARGAHHVPDEHAGRDPVGGAGAP